MENKHRGLAIGSMTTGIVSTSISAVSLIVSFFFLLPGCIGAAISIACGIVAIALSNRSRPMGRAIAGIVLGIVGVSISGILLLINLILIFIFHFPML
ncbi:hypothetical protein [Amedibacterium intestinale]|uniref:hypothetical protein n=1 Tax=Amedibacterium intestinale TaxID=2583452 RepID=UPI000E1FE1DE|nr:hypothetical protein DW220_10275 [Eubacterium sp. AM18-26]RHO23505.1 hypothetical protein DW212_10505 [Eubacterium sp. AM18-10LB-B]RHO26011.1 hypothetical protein DW208_11655 [Erysipelotrichaceae bacterium AM17-60]